MTTQTNIHKRTLKKKVEIDVDIESTMTDEPCNPLQTVNDPPGFTMCWDNVGKKVVT